MRKILYSFIEVKPNSVIITTHVKKKTNLKTGKFVTNFHIIVLKRKNQAATGFTKQLTIIYAIKSGEARSIQNTTKRLIH